jgi:hypothetical protein
MVFLQSFNAIDARCSTPSAEPINERGSNSQTLTLARHVAIFKPA